MSFLSVFQSGVNDVVAALQQYQASLVNNLRSQVQKVFQQHHGSGLEKDVLAVFDQIEDPFASVSTTYRQDDVIKRNFNFVESEEVCVGYTAVMGKKGKKREKKIPHYCAQMFSLCSACQKFGAVIVPSKSFGIDR